MATASTSRPRALITGASSGIGFELANVFARHGYDLVVAAEDGGLGDAAARLAALGIDVEPCQVDLATSEGVEELYARASQRPIDVAALNAGVGVAGDFARETVLEDELRLIQLNVISTVQLAKRVLKQMVARGSGRVLFTASIAGIMPTPLAAVYGASKAFILEFSASLHKELEDTGIVVTALMPGPTDTNFFHRAGNDDTKLAQKAKENDPAEVARQAYDALMKGKERVVAGNLSVKMQGWFARFMPEHLKATLHHKESIPGTGRQR